MQSRNPVLGRRGAFSRGGYATSDVPSAERLERMYAAPAYTPPRAMTYDDVVMRTAATLGVLLVAGAASWVLNLGLGVAIVALLVGFGLAMYIIFRRSANPAPILAYAAAEGVVLGVVSHVYESAYAGIVVQAILGTVLAFVGMLAVYASGRIRVTPKFTKIVVGAGFALVGLMIVNLVARIFLPTGIGIRADTPLGIAFSLVAIVVGCLFLALDFASIEHGVRRGAPQREAWVAAFGLTLTLVWIYLEILRLLSYLRD
ncbi:MAG: Bax inhibitor-1/YccA family protein [Streptosporangiaceae bacterium]